ncbi:MAG: hybrid sensor histidine kinase/response regulator, partial [Microcella sp.]
AVRDARGRIVRIQGALVDLSNVVREREERRAAEDALRLTLDQVDDGFAFFDEQFRYTYVNPAAERVLGLSAQVLLGSVIWDVLDGSYDSVFGESYRQAMSEKRRVSIRNVYRPTGRWFESIAYPTASGLAVYFRDVTAEEERNLERQRLLAEAEAMASLLDASNEAMIMEDLDYVITYWNQGAEQIYGWTAEEVIGRRAGELLYSDPAVFAGPAEALLRDGRWSGEMVQRTKDGREVIIQCRWQAVRDDEGRPVKFFAVNSDVTAQRREREQQARAQRMESLGTLAGGIAHDLNNVLTPLLMSTQLLRKQQTNPDHARMLETMEASIVRGAHMIRQVLTFARGVEGLRAAFDVGDVVDELHTFAAQVLPKSIECVCGADDGLVVVGDRTQLLQVLMNLVTNARDAMPEGGRITVRATLVELTGDAASALSIAPGEFVAVSVADSGIGMDADTRERAFDPFFTTKKQGQGTGLGLASSLAIVRGHGGAVTVDSAPDVGSTLTVLLPYARDTRIVGGADSANGRELHGNGELVLVVDDEQAVRSSVRAMLEAHGFMTLEAANGRDALSLVERHAPDVALVFTDVMMPLMDGAALNAELASRYPYIPVIAASGLDVPVDPTRWGSARPARILSKPFTSDALLQAIARVVYRDDVESPPSSAS